MPNHSPTPLEAVKRTQEALDASLVDQIPAPEARELPADSAWEQWDAAVRMVDLCEVLNVELTSRLRSG